MPSGISISLSLKIPYRLATLLAWAIGMAGVDTSSIVVIEHGHLHHWRIANRAMQTPQEDEFLGFLLVMV
jgi:hypothetical protein